MNGMRREFHRFLDVEAVFGDDGSEIDDTDGAYLDNLTTLVDDTDTVYDNGISTALEDSTDSSLWYNNSLFVVFGALLVGILGYAGVRLYKTYKRRRDTHFFDALSTDAKEITNAFEMIEADEDEDSEMYTYDWTSTNNRVPAAPPDNHNDPLEEAGLDQPIISEDNKFT